MSIATAITTAQQRVASAYTAISNKGGTLPATQNLVNMPTAIGSIYTAPQEASTDSAMDAYLTTANIGKVFKFTGTTTSKYKNGKYYLCKMVDLTHTVDLTVSGQSYGFESSSVLTLDQTVYNGPYQSTNKGITSSKSVAKITVSGTRQFSIWINSYAESNYDYAIASQLDASTIPSSSNGSYGHTQGYQKNPSSGLNTTYWKKLTYTPSNTDSHFIYLVFVKDYSVNSYNDRGYFVIERNALIFEEYTNEPAGLEPFHTESGVLTRGTSKTTDITGKFSTYTEIGWQALFYAYFRCGLTLTGTLNLTALTKVGSGGMLSAFASTSITGFSAPALTEIGINGMKEVCQDTLVEGEVRFPELTTVGLDGLASAFVRTKVTKMYFNKLNTCNQSGLSGMLTGCTTCTEIHFKSGTESLIQGLDGYSDKFGASNATIYWDL